jgi:tetratricopeptide (TPR) repeat protein
MDYPYLAVEYLEKVKINEVDTFIVRYGIVTQKRLAISYSKLGRTEKALELLQNCLRYVIEEKRGDKLTLGGVYRDIGRVYQDAGIINKALENFDVASQHFDKKSEAYQMCLCYKATLLRSNNRINEAMKCVDEGLPITTKGTLWHESLTAIKHSLNLEEKASREYLEWTSIPKLLEYGKHLLVMKCYEWLSSFYRGNKKHKPTHIYIQKATKIYKQLMEGDLSL